MLVSLFPFFIFFASFSVYLFTAFPSIYWRDAPEFQAIGFLLDIAHPAGSPLYAMIVKLFTFIPIGGIAFKTILVSCFFGALIPVIVYWMLLRILEKLSNPKTESSQGLFIPLIALMTTLFFSFSNAIWENSRVPEVYTLQNFFTALFILILLNIERMKSHFSPDCDHKILKLFMVLLFLFGLSLGAHAILILYAPLLFLWVYFDWLKRASFNPLKIVPLLLFFFLLGFSVYLYLPIRSAQDPYYDWGNPETFQNLMIHASDRKDASHHFSVQKSVLPRQMSMYSGFYPDNFSHFGVIIGFIGLFYVFLKKEKRLLLLFALFFFPPFLFFIRYWGETSAFIPNFLVFDILMGVGFWICLITIKRQFEQNKIKKNTLYFAWVLIGIQFCLLFSSHYEKNTGSNYWTPRAVTKTILNDLPPNSVVITTLTWFMLSYLQQAEGYRPDVSVLSLSSFLAPDFFSKLTQSKFPNIIIPESASLELGSAFLSRNIDRHPIYWEAAGIQDHLVEKYLVPDGFLFKVNATPSEINEEVVQAYLAKLGKQIHFDDISEDREERLLFAEVIAGIGNFFMTRHVYEMARHHFEMAAALVPNEPHYRNALGSAYAYLEKHELAEKSFLKSISLKPYNYIPYLNLAKIYHRENNLEKAESYFKMVLDLHPNHLHALRSLGKISMKKGNEQEGIDYFQQILKINPADEEAKAQVALLPNVQ